MRTARKNNEDVVRCQKKGKWTTERNPFYLTLEHYFAEDMAKRGCVIPTQPLAKRAR